MKYRLVCLGGTFDFFHKGHKALIKKAFSVGEKAVIGVISDEYRKTRAEKNRIIGQSFGDRIKELAGYLKKKKYFNRGKIVRLDDPYGPAVLNPDFDAIVVSESTLKGAEEINRKREIKGFKPLKIIKIPLVKDENGKIISSSRIKKGEINRQGMVFGNLFKNSIILSSPARQELKIPQGKIIKNLPLKQPKKLIILVGDLATKRFLDKKIKFNLGIIDLQVERKPKNLFTQIFLKESVRYIVKNKAGTITKELAEKIEEVIEKKPGKEKIIRVIGEEDLSAVPAILLSPLGSLVFYGQPKEGLVMVEVTEKVKNKLIKLIISK